MDLEGWLRDPNFRFDECVLVQDEFDCFDELGDIFLVDSTHVAAPFVGGGGVDLRAGCATAGEGDGMSPEYDRFMNNFVRLWNHLSLHLQFIIINNICEMQNKRKKNAPT